MLASKRSAQRNSSSLPKTCQHYPLGLDPTLYLLFNKLYYAPCTFPNASIVKDNSLVSCEPIQISISVSASN
jgi:hypothetical protein